MNEHAANEVSSQHHRDQASQKGPIPFSLVTVSDTRTATTDDNGRYLQERIAEQGHTVCEYHVIKDDVTQIEEILERLSTSGASILIFNGGTGIAKGDRTFDVVSRYLEKTLPGFGEIFRMLSYDQVGAAAMLSRAVAGTYGGKVLISVPGSPQAVALAWEKLIAPECAHLAWELTR